MVHCTVFLAPPLNLSIEIYSLSSSPLSFCSFFVPSQVLKQVAVGEGLWEKAKTFLSKPVLRIVKNIHSALPGYILDPFNGFSFNCFATFFMSGASYFIFSCKIFPPQFNCNPLVYTGFVYSFKTNVKSYIFQTIWVAGEQPAVLQTEFLYLNLILDFSSAYYQTLCNQQLSLVSSQFLCLDNIDYVIDYRVQMWFIYSTVKAEEILRSDRQKLQLKLLWIKHLFCVYIHLFVCLFA